MIGNSPNFTVSDFVAVFNQSLTTAYPEVVITGELSNFKISKNTWVYFDLKDELASVKFFGTRHSLPGPLEDGMMLEVVGRPYLHPQFGFSVQFQAVQVTGEGSINKAQILLAKKLQKEGLFDESRKRPLPYAPETVAIIASKESAGYGDFIKITKKRWPSLKTTLFDVKVQGIDAPDQIISAIKKANQGDFEALIVVRGGGSRDDLAAFDHEQLVRTLASSRIPTLVAIGHERDVVLAELVADVRASTPSNAAEILVPDAQHELQLLKSKKQQLNQALEVYQSDVSQQIGYFAEHLDDCLQVKYDQTANYFDQAMALLNAYDPKLPLSKGYAIVRSSGQLIKSAKAGVSKSEFDLEFNDGIIKVEKGTK